MATLQDLLDRADRTRAASDAAQAKAQRSRADADATIQQVNAQAEADARSAADLQMQLAALGRLVNDVLAAQPDHEAEDTKGMGWIGQAGATAPRAVTIPKTTDITVDDSSLPPDPTINVPPPPAPNPMPQPEPGPGPAPEPTPPPP